jgi:hypothetical protein
MLLLDMRAKPNGKRVGQLVTSHRIALQSSEVW